MLKASGHASAVAPGSSVLRHFRTLLGEAGFENPKAWTTRELRTSFVSLLPDHRMPIEEIARVLGHDGTATTEKVYRKQLRPVITAGAEAMDEIFGNASKGCPTSQPTVRPADMP
ncbi:tyrosine-type recombinase/integrase [Streptomyces sp. VNUA116]|uniref:tyrosine-type recombinase/integrase n=1 Tax=Streptomyces sp. VNUA116 TaxID=3062449 RepID=UPI0026744575|nr:tyrosine-type recombinase/integrase [Streptomyces sp. VNUA116]WKU48049.1 tyrosine-type recombinase/integrase [Streptomyces sp. VNUA116]